MRVSDECLSLMKSKRPARPHPGHKGKDLNVTDAPNRAREVLSDLVKVSRDVFELAAVARGVNSADAESRVRRRGRHARGPFPELEHAGDFRGRPAGKPDGCAEDENDDHAKLPELAAAEPGEKRKMR